MMAARKIVFAAITLSALAACQTASAPKAPIIAKSSGEGRYVIPQTGTWKDFYSDPRDASTPYDVRLFINSAQACGHFAGEEPYDAKRAAFLKRMIDENCAEIIGDYKDLRRKYIGNVPVTAEIEEVWASIGGEETEI